MELPQIAAASASPGVEYPERVGQPVCQVWLPNLFFHSVWMLGWLADAQSLMTEVLIAHFWYIF